MKEQRYEKREEWDIFCKVCGKSRIRCKSANLFDESQGIAG
jgi:hypothetical protein